MFEGNKFLPLTGIPIWKMARIRTLFAVWLPDPLTVATSIEKSLIKVFISSACSEESGARGMEILSGLPLGCKGSGAGAVCEMARYQQFE